MRIKYLLLLFVFATQAAAQLEPDDFVDPALHRGPLFISRLVAGAVGNSIADYRPRHDDVAFVQLVNNLYWSHVQLGYRHTEMHAETPPPQAFACGCSERIFFPSPRLPGETPAPPPAGATDAHHFGWYRSVPRAGRDPLVLRYQLTWMRQSIHRTLRSAATHEPLEGLDGDEQFLGIDADTHVRIRGRDHFGSLALATIRRRGTVDDRIQNELTYTHRFRIAALKSLLLRPTLTVGGISDRGGTAINLLNPLLELFWQDRHTGVNVHLVYSPQLTNSTLGGWETHHQIALFADRALFVKLFH